MGIGDRGSSVVPAVGGVTRIVLETLSTGDLVAVERAAVGMARVSEGEGVDVGGGTGVGEALGSGGVEERAEEVLVEDVVESEEEELSAEDREKLERMRAIAAGKAHVGESSSVVVFPEEEELASDAGLVFTRVVGSSRERPVMIGDFTEVANERDIFIATR